jgi:hypothetical protein
MTEEKKNLNGRSLAGFILSISVPLITLVLCLIIIPIILRINSVQIDAINTAYIIIRIAVSVTALLTSISGFKTTRNGHLRGHKLAVAGIVISGLQLILCILLLLGGIFNGLSLPIESPPQATTT